MTFPSQRQGLPPWFNRPSPAAGSNQRGLFESPLGSVLPRLQVSLDELLRWRLNGWISFAPCATLVVDEMGDPIIWEIVFVRDIVRSGLSDSQVLWLLSQCPKPYSYDPNLIVFSFAHGWVEAIPPVFPDPPEQVIEDNLDSWLETRDTDRLADLRDQISELLSRPRGKDDRGKGEP
jgi:hypothetical protein